MIASVKCFSRIIRYKRTRMDLPKLQFQEPSRIYHKYLQLNKFPRFWRIDPEIWFVQVEAFFTINGIDDERDMFTLLVASVDHCVLPYIADIIYTSLRTYNNNMYETVKKRILEVFGKDEETRLRELIRDSIHVVERPSQLLKAMVATSNGRVDEQRIKSLFFGRIHRFYEDKFNEGQSIEEIGKIADSIAACQAPFMHGFWDPLTPNHHHHLAQVESKEISASIVRSLR